MLEMLLPEYAKQLLENYQNIYSQLASQLRWLYFDDASRLVTRVGYLDDGWIRVRVDAYSALDINLVEVLRELSWTFYNIAETNMLLEGVALMKSGAGLSRAINVLHNFSVVVPFMVQLVSYSEVYIEGEVFVDGDLLVV